MTTRVILSGATNAVVFDFYSFDKSMPRTVLEKKVYKEGVQLDSKRSYKKMTKKMTGKYELMEQMLNEIRQIIVENQIKNDNVEVSLIK